MLQNVGCSTGLASQMELDIFVLMPDTYLSSLFHLMIYIVIKRFMNEIQKSPSLNSVELVKIKLTENVHGELHSGYKSNSFLSSAGRQKTLKMIRSSQAEINVFMYSM